MTRIAVEPPSVRRSGIAVALVLGPLAVSVVLRQPAVSGAVRAAFGRDRRRAGARGDGPPVPTVAQSAAYRIVRESLGMRERASGLGGTLEAGPGPNGGRHVRATLPTGPMPA